MPDWPAVTCLCPTFGRFAHLRRALQCFLDQDYPGEKRLLILNDGREPVRVGAAMGTCGVEVANRARFASLGDKRSWLLRAAGTPLVAHWDDDDLYLSWHLTRGVRALLDADAGCVKSEGAWWMLGRAPGLEVRGPEHNYFEGSMLFWRDEALARGGYPPLHSGQAKALLEAFHGAGRLHGLPDADRRGRSAVSYVYRWSHGLGHISAIGNRHDAAQAFGARNDDHPRGRVLTPGSYNPEREALRRYWSREGIAIGPAGIQSRARGRGGRI